MIFRFKKAAGAALQKKKKRSLRRKSGRAFFFVGGEVDSNRVESTIRRDSVGGADTGRSVAFRIDGNALTDLEVVFAHGLDD